MRMRVFIACTPQWTPQRTTPLVARRRVGYLQGGVAPEGVSGECGDMRAKSSGRRKGSVCVCVRVFAR